MSGDFRILVVCTGNICRSPTAEQLLINQFLRAQGGDKGWTVPTVISAGTHALVGAPMPIEAASLSAEFGGNPSAHAAQQLTSGMIDNANMVLAMAREHRSAVARLVPRASRYSFTLRELARILGDSTETAGQTELPLSGEFDDWLNWARAKRGYFAGSPDDDDVVDPYGRHIDVYRESALQIAPAVETIVRVMSR